MKKYIQLLMCFLFSGFLTMAQGKYTVNNMPSYSADFNNLQNAIDSVPNGSILIVQGSNTSYGVININKPIVIMGSGYNHNTVPEQSSIADNSTTKILKINIDSLGTGTIISGIYCQQNLVILKTSNVSIIGNLLHDGIYVNKSSNVLISRNYFRSSTSGVSIISHYGPSASSTIKNNIFDIWSSHTIVNLDQGNPDNSGPNVIFENNTVLRTAGNPGSFTSGSFSGFNLGSVFIKNNIFVNIDSNTTTNIAFKLNTWHPGTIYTFVGNICSDSSFVGTNGTMNNVSISSLFQNINNNNYGLEWQVLDASNSPAIGYGSNGVTSGAFGGTIPYKLGGKNLIPNIYEMNVAPVGSNTQGLDIQIKARANK